MSLDDLLAAWASGVRLPDAAASDIYQQIVATPVPAGVPGLEPRWWREFTTEVAAWTVASTRPVRWLAQPVPVSRG
jgi:hypothetical protein